jgi:WhiB family transcriptional regulator, redox-sensing transcriptional regulator
MSTVHRLPGPAADSWDWQRRGACRGRGTTQFFHPDGERGSSRARREEAAKRMCRACPVRAECAAHALTVREPYGVWGGFTEAERLHLLATGGDELVDQAGGRADIRLLEQRLRYPYAPRQREPAAVA